MSSTPEVSPSYLGRPHPLSNRKANPPRHLPQQHPPRQRRLLSLFLLSLSQSNLSILPPPITHSYTHSRKNTLPIPNQILRTRSQRLTSNNDDHILFLNSIRRILRWLPQERPSAEELADDEFPMQPVLAQISSPD
ncbi:uncharacterized protein BDW47DRAFT_112716 [Aspergillus candidus]|uniref:Uncharacterized protein n=1 Tax=Aspergillus candidus TaxID=41067 RepID=A0A2I2F0H2_ASPCN|nr:hypothetical protein BDW47DRAFT_112716 [Aspergillus candidus]PLB34121.1 hypothetical protein BDW47DRAFT_112716 [Aspergillus candidus]